MKIIEDTFSVVLVVLLFGFSFASTCTLGTVEVDGVVEGWLGDKNVTVTANSGDCGNLPFRIGFVHDQCDTLEAFYFSELFDAEPVTMVTIIPEEEIPDLTDVRVIVEYTDDNEESIVHCSEVFKFDRTPPKVPVGDTCFYIDPAFATEETYPGFENVGRLYYTAIFTLAATWTAVTDDSCEPEGCTYEWAVGTGRTKDDVVPWTNVGHNIYGSALVSNLDAISASYGFFVAARATNKVGLVSGYIYHQGAGLKLDLTAPTISGGIGTYSRNSYGSGKEVHPFKVIGGGWIVSYPALYSDNKYRIIINNAYDFMPGSSIVYTLDDGVEVKKLVAAGDRNHGQACSVMINSDNTVVFAHNPKNSFMPIMSNMNDVIFVSYDPLGNMIVIVKELVTCTCGDIMVPVVYKYLTPYLTIEGVEFEVLYTMCPMVGDNCYERNSIGATIDEVSNRLWFAANDGIETFITYIDLTTEESTERKLDEIWLDFTPIGDIGCIGIREDGELTISWPGYYLDGLTSTNTPIDVTRSYLLESDTPTMSVYSFNVDSSSRVYIKRVKLDNLDESDYSFSEYTRDGLIHGAVVDGYKDIFAGLNTSSNGIYVVNMGPVETSFPVGCFDTDDEFGINLKMNIATCSENYINTPHLLTGAPEYFPNFNTEYWGSEIRVRFEGFADETSGVSDNYFSFGNNDPDYNNVVDNVNIGQGNTYTFTKPETLEPVEGDTYRAMIKGTNTIGSYTKIFSSAREFDTTPPTSTRDPIFISYDTEWSCPSDSSTTEAASTEINEEYFAFDWAFADDKSGAGDIEWCMRKDGSSTCDVIDWVTVNNGFGLSTYNVRVCVHFEDHEKLQAIAHNDRIQLVVRGHDLAGNSVEAASAVVTLLGDRPMGGQVIDVRPNLEEGLLRLDVDIHNQDALEADWSMFLAGSAGLDLVDYQYGFAAEGGYPSEWTSTGLETTIKIDNPPGVMNAGKYQVYVRCYDSGGKYKEMRTDGVTVENIAPVIDAVWDGVGDTEIDLHSDRTAIGAQWNATDTGGSTMSHYEVGIGVCDSGTYVISAPVNIGLVNSISLTDLVMYPFIKYCATVFAFDKAGNMASMQSDGFIIDESGPLIEWVVDGKDANDDTYLSASEPVSVCWSEIKDVESGVEKVEACLGETEPCDIKDYEIIPLLSASAEEVIPSGSFSWDDTIGSEGFVKVTLKATNFAGLETILSTNGVFADTTPPVNGTVFNGLQPVEVEYTSSLTTLSARWDGFVDPDSGISEFFVTVGTVALESDVLDEVSVGGATYVTLDSLNLQHGKTYYVTVIAVNPNGLTHAVAAGGVKVDTTPPSVVSIHVDDDDIGYITETTSVDVEFEFTDPESSGVLKYSYAIGTQPKSGSERDWTEVDDLVFSASDLTLAPGQTYYVSVSAYSPAHPVPVVQTSQPFVVDINKPIAGSVWDMYKFSDSRFTSDNTKLIGYFTGFVDQESRIKYEVGIGRVAGVADVVDFVPLDLSDVSNIAEGSCDTQNPPVCVEDTIFTSTIAASLSNGSYFFVVKAIDQAGNYVIASSNGITVDTSAPIPSEVYDGSEYHVDASVQTDTSSLSASWIHFSDAQSGMSRYRWAIGTASDEESVWSFTSVGLSTYATATDLTLSPGETYYITVEGTNKAALTSKTKSDGILIEDPSNPSSPEFSLSAANYAWGGESYSVPERNTCSCAVPQMTFSTYWGECVCPSTSFFDARIQQCVACPGGSTREGTPRSLCKEGTNTQIDYPPQTYSNCVPHVAGMSLYDSECVCGPGRFMSEDGECTLCPEGTFKHEAGNSIDMCYSCPPTANVLVLETPDTIDDETDDVSYIYSIGTTIEGEQWVMMESKQPTTDEFHYIFDLPFDQATKYHIMVEGVNEAGLKTVKQVTTTEIDVQAPLQGSVNDGLTADIEYQTSQTEISANWFDFMEDSSNITKYKGGIGSSQGVYDIIPMSDLGSITEYTWTISALPNGSTCYVAVVAYSNNGLTSIPASSDGVTIDIEAPVFDHISTNDYQTSASIVEASWRFTDELSGIAKYEWSIGNSPNDETFLEWTSTGLSVHGSVENMSFEHGDEYYVNVRAYDGVGNVSTETSTKCVVDLEKPTLSNLEFKLDNGSNTPSSIKYYNELTITPQWSLQTSLIPIKSQHLTIGKCPNGAHTAIDLSVPVVSDGDGEQSITLQNEDNSPIVLEHGGEYCFGVTIETEIGDTITEWADQSLIIDIEEPILESITVAEFGEGNVVAVDDEGRVCLNVSWIKPVDISPIIYQSIIACDDESCTNPTLGTQVHSSSRVSKLCLEDLLPSTSGTFIGVLVTDSADNSAMLLEPMFTDNTAPTIVINNVDNEGKVITLSSYSNELSAEWDISDNESEVTSMKYQILTSASDVVVDWTDIALGNVGITVSDLSLENNVTYKFLLSATNAAGLENFVESAGVLVDLTSPENGFICIEREEASDLPVEFSPDCSCVCCDNSSTSSSASECPVLFINDASESLNAVWFDQKDDETGLEKFEIMVGTSAEANQLSYWLPSQSPESLWELVIPPTLVGKSTFEMERTHMFTLRTHNKAGLTSMTTSQEVMLDTTAPECGSSTVSFINAVFKDNSNTDLVIDLEWEECIDEESDIAGIVVSGLTSSPFKIPVYDGSMLTTLPVLADVTGLDTAEVQVQVYNFAGGVTTLTGSLPIDLTPPVIGKVRDGIRPTSQEDRDMDCQSSSSSLGINWDQIIDSESSINKLEVAVGTCVGCDDIVEFKSISLANGRNFSFGNLSDDVQIGKMYYVSIRATNSFGLSSVGSSDGFRVICPSDDIECESLFGTFTCVAF